MSFECIKTVVEIIVSAFSSFKTMANSGFRSLKGKIKADNHRQIRERRDNWGRVNNELKTCESSVGKIFAVFIPLSPAGKSL